MKRKYRNIAIPEPLFEQIELVVKHGKYTSVTEFVKEAIRLRLEQVSRSSALVSIQNY